MLKHILNALELVEYGENELIDIAKGKYKKIENWQDFKKELKRIFR